jgi:1,2-diacylglycerol 3-beta-galactosyltransferase
MDHKRILLLYADAGFGHRSAAMAIKAAMEEIHGQECTVDMVNPLEDDRTPSMLRDSQYDYDNMVRNMPELYKIGYEASDSTFPRALMDGALMLMLYDVMKDLVKRYRPDVIASTYLLYQAPLDAVFTVEKESIPIVVTVTDLVSVHSLWFYPGVDMCLVPTIEVQNLAYQSGLPEEKVILNGIPISPQIPQETRTKAELRNVLGIRPDLYTFLVPGSKRMEGVPEILTGLNHSGLPVQLILVAGGDDALYQKFQQEEWHLPVKIYNFVDFMPMLMHASDIVVCKAGGLTVSESLGCGLPMMIMNVLPGQESGNADYVVQHQAGVLIKDPLALLETSMHWLENNGQLLAEFSRNACRVGHPRSAYRAAEKIWQAANMEPSSRTVTHLFERAKLVRSLNNYRKQLGKRNRDN